MVRRYLIFALFLATVLVWISIYQRPDNKLHLIFCNVGQGDAILVIQGSFQALIDGGPNRRVLDCLSGHLPFWDRTIELAILTHPEADHFTGLIDVTDRYNIKEFVSNGLVVERTGFREFQKVVVKEGALVHTARSGEKIRVGLLDFSVLNPITTSVDINETSLVFKLSFGDFDALLTGDISQKIENQLIIGPVEILKVAHHGSKYSSSEEFLAKVSPALAIISVGKNSFGHPTKEVLDRLSQIGAKIMRTDQNGEIEIVSDGKNWHVKSRFDRDNVPTP